MRREWTEKEVAYLNKKYIYQPVEKTAKALDRTVASVKHKANKLGLNHYTDFLNAKTIAKCFSSDVAVVIHWVEKYGLPAKIIMVANNQKRYLIDADDFWKWASKHREIINWSKYEKGSILPEPGWVAEQVRSYTTTMHRKKITDMEKERIKIMLRKGMTYKEIAEQIGRSYNSINHICRYIYM